MNFNKTSLFIACSVFMFLLVSPLSAIEVEYKVNGNINKVKGVKVDTGKYIFNKGQSKKITISTLNWPPYIGENICGQGWVQQVTVGALLSKGYEVKTEFRPWKRAVRRAEKGQSDGLYPEYQISDNAPSDIIAGKKRTALLALSDKFPGGPLAFWRKKGSGVKFDGDLKKLKNVPIGVVSGYENTIEFDQLMDSGYLNVSKAKDDWINIKKLYKGRISLIVGDPIVLEYTVYQNLKQAQAKKWLKKLETVNPVLEEKFLYLALSKRKKGYKTRLNDFNSALKGFKKSGELNRLITKYVSMSSLDQSCK